MHSWPSCKLSDVANVFSGYAFKGTDMSKEGGIPLIKIKNIHGKKVHKNCETYLNPEAFKKNYKKYLLNEDDFLVAMTGQGSVGRLGKMRSYEEGFLVNQRVGIVRVDEDKAYPEFVYQSLATDNTEGMYFNLAMGAGQPNLSPKDIGSAKIPLPPLPIQKKIAGILSAYDDLIENNLKRIRLLEELAQITYEEWFVRLRFPGHETTPINPVTGLPEGWENKNIGSLIEREIGGGWGANEIDSDHLDPAYVIRGTDIHGLNNSNIKNVPFRFHKKSNLRSRKLSHGDIVFEVSGGSRTEGVAKTGFITRALLEQFGKDVMCASFCKLVHPINCSIGLMLFHYFRFLRNIKATEIFEIRGASSIINYNWTAFLKFQKMPTPPNELIEKFYRNVIVVHDEIQNLSCQNQCLHEARDILLPRLMTGMIDVEEYDPSKLLQEAA